MREVYFVSVCNITYTYVYYCEILLYSLLLKVFTQSNILYPNKSFSILSFAFEVEFY